MATIDDILKAATEAPSMGEKASRTAKFIPVIQQLADKNYNVNQIYDFLKARGATVGKTVISKHRRAYLSERPAAKIKDIPCANSIAPRVDGNAIPAQGQPASDSDFAANFEAILSSLAQKRPIFHSEADFQHALGREVHHFHSDSDVRLEVPSTFLNKRASIDLIVRVGRKCHYLELKYKTALATVQHERETFSLKSQGAKDHGSYDFLKDISRVEAFVRGTPGATGWVIMLTNVESYWKGSSKPDPIDKDFHLLEGRELSGKLAWRPHAGAGSIRKREESIDLRGRYLIRWRPYAKLSGRGSCTFRYLCFPIDAYDGIEAETSPSPATLETPIKVPKSLLHPASSAAPRIRKVRDAVPHPPHGAWEVLAKAAVPVNQQEAVLLIMKALGRRAHHTEVKSIAKQQWDMDIKSCGTVMTDMVSPSEGGNQTSKYSAHLRILVWSPKGSGFYRLQ